MNAGIYVTEYNTDYNSGGFYISKNKKKYFLDHFVSSGDLVLFPPNIIHGVDPVFNSKLNSIHLVTSINIVSNKSKYFLYSFKI